MVLRIGQRLAMRGTARTLFTLDLLAVGARALLPDVRSLPWQVLRPSGCRRADRDTARHRKHVDRLRADWPRERAQAMHRDALFVLPHVVVGEADSDTLTVRAGIQGAQCRAVPTESSDGDFDRIDEDSARLGAK